MFSAVQFVPLGFTPAYRLVDYSALLGYILVRYCYWSRHLSTCICRVVVPALAVLPLRGALPFREPKPPKPSTTARHCLDFLGSSLPFVLPFSFHLLLCLLLSALHWLTSPCNLAICHPLSGATLTIAGAALTRSFPNITIFLSLLTSSSFIPTSLQIFQSLISNLTPFLVSITCAACPCQKYLWGTLGAQVIDRKKGHLPQNGP